MQSYLPETQEYLSRFFKAKFLEYHQAMVQYQPKQGYGYYFKFREVSQALFDIVLNIDEPFGDLRIPESFSSPEHLVESLLNFRDFLLKNNILLKEVFDYYEKKGKEPPQPVYKTYQINNEVLSAVQYALSLDEVHSYQKISALNIIERLLRRFHLAAKQLEQQHNQCSVFEIKSEYDVQNLLHALLKIHFDDLRAEEVCPSHAGGSSRVDFLLKSESIMIEVKKTQNNYKEKKIGDDLIIDISRYSEHPEVRTLVCFIYDPDMLIKNPTGLSNDLENKSTDNMQVKVFIVPESPPIPKV